MRVQRNQKYVDYFTELRSVTISDIGENLFWKIAAFRYRCFSLFRSSTRIYCEYQIIVFRIIAVLSTSIRKSANFTSNPSLSFPLSLSLPPSLSLSLFLSLFLSLSLYAGSLSYIPLADRLTSNQCGTYVNLVRIIR